MEKLNWFNSEYLKKMSIDQLTGLLLPYLKEANYITEEELSPEKLEWLKEIVNLMHGRFRNFSQFMEFTDYFFTDKIDIEPKAFQTVLNKDGVTEILTALKEKLLTVEYWDESNLETVVRSVASSLQIKAGKIIHPTRVSLTGKKIGPGLFELMVFLGKEKNIQRLEDALEKIKEVKNKT